MSTNYLTVARRFFWPVAIALAVLLGLAIPEATGQASAKFKRMDAYITDGRYNAAMFNFQAKAPGGSLTSGITNTVTMGAALGGCPLGVAGADTNHYLYISGGVGTAEAVLITGGTCTSGAASGTIAFTPANNHSGAWTIQSNSAGLLEALQAATATNGGTIALSNDITLSSPLVLVITDAKGVTLDLQGHTITCTNTSGICITVKYAVIGGTADRVKVSNGAITYGGASNTITGLKILNSAKNMVLDNLLISNFTTTGSTCLVLDNTESLSVIGTRLASCYAGLYITNNSTDNHFIGLQINPGGAGVPIKIDGTSHGASFEHALVQSSTNVHGVEVDASAATINGIRFRDSWFENVGDTTANTRVFYLNTAGTNYVTQFTVENTGFFADANGALGTIIEFAGTGIASSPSFKNIYSSYPTFFTGATVGFPLYAESLSPTYFDAGMNIGGLGGLFLFGSSLAHKYQMYAGNANVGDTNDLLIKDLTAATTVFKYHAATTTVTFPGAVTATTTLNSNVATGTAPLIVASTTPVANLTTIPLAYDHTGAQIVAAHIVQDLCVLGTSCAVTLAGSAVFTNNNSYSCVATDITSANPVQIAYTSGSQFTLTGTGTDTLRYICVGK